MTAARCVKDLEEQLGQGCCLHSQLRWPSLVVSIAGKVLHTCMLCSCEAAQGARGEALGDSAADLPRVRGVIRGSEGCGGFRGAEGCDRGAWPARLAQPADRSPRLQGEPGRALTTHASLAMLQILVHQCRASEKIAMVTLHWAVLLPHPVSCLDGHAQYRVEAPLAIGCQI